ncbi:MAG TPA: hypothetical protein VIZ44_12055 [Gaiellaceae bacterium]
MSSRFAIRVALVTVIGVLACAGLASAATNDISVTVDRQRVATQLGHKITFKTTIVNHASTSTGPLIAHLNVLSLRSGVEIDPEDWSTHRTRYLGAIPAGGSRAITYPVHAINTGRIALYVAVLPQVGSAQPPTTGPTVQLVVAKRDTLNAGGILPLALGIPALLALMAGGMQYARRRR